MNTSTRENDSIEKVNDHFSNAEDGNSSSRGVSRILKPILITILSISCLAGGIVLHKIHAVEINQKSKGHYGSYTATSSLSLLKENTSAPLDNPLKSITPMASLNSLSNASEIKPITSEPVQQESVPQEPVQTESSDTLTEETAVDTPISETPPAPKFLEGFTLKDALKFKENFLAENNCKNDYQKLLNVPNKTTEVLAVLNDLSPYCLNDQKPVQNVLEAFKKNKKEAFIAYYKKNNPAWLAYLKSIPVSLIEIRRINPIKNTPKNILYKAQNELLIQNVENAVNFVTQLPLEMQQKMDDFYREAAIYNRSLLSLDQLILSFERKGE